MNRFLCFKSRHEANTWILVCDRVKKSFGSWEAARDWALTKVRKVARA